MPSDQGYGAVRLGADHRTRTRIFRILGTEVEPMPPLAEFCRLLLLWWQNCAQGCDHRVNTGFREHHLAEALLPRRLLLGNRANKREGPRLLRPGPHAAAWIARALDGGDVLRLACPSCPASPRRR